MTLQKQAKNVWIGARWVAEVRCYFPDSMYYVPDSPSSHDLINTLSFISLSQLRETPTRLGMAKTLWLDIIICSNPEIVVNIGIVNCAISDHDLVTCNISWDIKEVKAKILRHIKFKKIRTDTFTMGYW